MAKKRRRKGKHHGVFRRALGRWAWGKVHSWAKRVRAGTKAGAKKVFGAKVIASTSKGYRTANQYPNPNRRVPLTESMRRVDEWLARFVVLLDNGWEVPFEVDIYEPRRPSIREAAYEAAARVHGEIARSRAIADITSTNLAGHYLLQEES